MRFREVWKPNLIWASAYRVGMARAFGGSELVATDQFRIGNSAALRAFGTDAKSLLPGNALLVTNQELRYPLPYGFGVVGFFDIGNTYQTIGTTKIFSQRYSPGFGLRREVPFIHILMRVDVGVNLWPRTGEDRKRISFGIGQAF
jgi:outer membrane protein assembly factor BamA